MLWEEKQGFLHGKEGNTVVKITHPEWTYQAYRRAEVVRLMLLTADGWQYLHEVALEVVYSDPQVVAGGGPSPAGSLKQPPPKIPHEEAVRQLQEYADYLYSQSRQQVPASCA